MQAANRSAVVAPEANLSNLSHWRTQGPLETGNPPVFIQFLSYSCSFRQKFPKYVGALTSGLDAPSRKSWIRHCIVCRRQSMVSETTLPFKPRADATRSHFISFGGYQLYRSGTVNSNTVNSKFHVIRSFFEIFARFLSFHV